VNTRNGRNVIDATKITRRQYVNKSSAVAEMGVVPEHSGPKSGSCYTLSVGVQGPQRPIYHNVVWAEAYRRTNYQVAS